MIYVFLADGFEEMEAVCPIDVLRRAGKKVFAVGVNNENSALNAVHSSERREITGTHGLKVIPDIRLSEIEVNSLDPLIGNPVTPDDNPDALDILEMIVLPGGARGVENLFANEKVKEIIEYCVENNIFIGAICAAPSILGGMGLFKAEAPLHGKVFTCYPDFEKYLKGAEISTNSVVFDEEAKIISAKGAGVALQFGLKLVEVLCGAEKAEKLSGILQCER